MPAQVRLSAELAERAYTLVRQLADQGIPNDLVYEANAIANGLSYLDRSLEHSTTSMRRGMASPSARTQMQREQEAQRWTASQLATEEQATR